MKIIRGLEKFKGKIKSRFLAIGIFDGVHRGHQKILSCLVRDAQDAHQPAFVMTFDPHPSAVLAPSRVRPLLISLDHRMKIFERLGVDVCWIIRFSKKFSHMSPKSFMNDLLVKRAGVKHLYVGSDFRFGRRAKGDVTYLKHQKPLAGFTVHEVRPVPFRQKPISSTRLRALIEKGDLRQAREMLGRPVSLWGRVVQGCGMGKTVGYRTANIDYQHEVLPPCGVYASLTVWKGKGYPSIVNIGFRPTVTSNNASFSFLKDPTVEVHLFDFQSDIYGRLIEVFLMRQIRTEKKFRSINELSHQIKKDIQVAKQILKRAKAGRFAP